MAHVSVTGTDPCFESAARGIESHEDSLRAKAEKAQDDAVDDLLAAHTIALTTSGATPDAIASSHASTTDALSQLAAQGSNRAANALSTLLQQGENYNPLLAADLARDIASGQMPSPASIDELVRLGRIKASEANDLKGRLPSSAAVEKAKGLRPEIQRLVRGVFANTLAEQGITSTDAGSATALLEGQMTDELEELTQTFASQNPDASPAEVREFIRTRADALSKQKRFIPEIKDGRVVPKAALEQSSRVNKFLNPVTGTQTRDFIRADPAQVRTSRPVTRTDYLINSQELAQNQQAFMQGGGPTPRVRALMGATGKDWGTFLRDQSTAYGIPFTSMSQSQAAKAATERRRLAPAASAVLTNPNATPQQRVRAWNDITAARQRSAQREAGKVLGPSTLQPGSRVQIPDAVGLAQEAGFTKEQAAIMAAIAMAESSGNSGAHNNNRQTGDDSYGLWQINMIDRLGPERRRQFGIQSNDQLKDPRINAKAAKAVFDSQGFGAWSVYRSGSYRQYLPEARRALSQSFREAQ
jgi:hypothetical protein